MFEYPLNDRPEQRKNAVHRSEGGFSLIEIMVAIGVAGVLTYAISQMLLNSGKQATSVTSKTDFNSFVNELQSVFNNTGNCLKAFGGTGVTKINLTSLATAPMPVSLQVGGNTYAANSTFGGPGGGSKRSLTISKLEFTGASPASVANQFVLPLSFVATRQVQAANAENAVGGNNLSHTFNLIMTLDPAHDNAIVACAGQYTDFWSSTGPSGLDIIYTGGKVAIGGAAVDPPSAELDVDGTIQANAFMYQSDARLKENVREIPSALERVLKLRGVEYDWKNKKGSARGNTDQLGLLAQEVEAVFPEAVVTNEHNGLKSVGYGNLLAPVVEAFKEQREIISRQQREIAELQRAILRKK